MKDLRADLRDLYRSFSQSPSPEGGRSVMFVAARAGEGVSSIAASFARLAAEQAHRAVWLVDLDLKRNHLFNSFAVGPFAETTGGVGPPYSASLKTEPFFSIEPAESEARSGLGLFTAHRVGDTRLMVTQFDATRLTPTHAIRIRAQPAYWQVVRSVTDWAIVDAPALELSAAGLAITSQMDRTVIVARAGSATPADIETLRCEIEAHGGAVAGVVLNGRRGDAQIADRFAT
jgi:Mrp family chromosome partitioning ATPase